MDLSDLDEAVKIADQVAPYIDILEAGTPLILKEGLQAVTMLKRNFPGKEVLADLKIADAGKIEASMGFQAGADIVTVLGVSGDRTIAGVIQAARNYNRRVMVDLIYVKDIETRTRTLLRMGVDYLCVHTAFDVQDGIDNPLLQLQQAKRQCPLCRLAVAGGINISLLEQLQEEDSVGIAVVGGAITGEANRLKIAKQMYEIALSEKEENR